MTAYILVQLDVKDPDKLREYGSGLVRKPEGPPSATTRRHPDDIFKH
jgi:hypothetical protein